jgi:Fic family protein
MAESLMGSWADAYPFLKFNFDMRQMPPATFVLLGECASKIEHVAGVPLEPDEARHLYQIFVAKGVHGTAAIEGNTLSEGQVRQRIEGKLELPESQAYLGKEIDNLERGYNWLIDQARDGKPLQVSADALKHLNAMVLRDLEVPADVQPGQFRTHRVGVSDYLSPAPDNTEDLIDRFCGWMTEPNWNEVFGGTFVLPILHAIIGHVYFAWIHPFGDGNGRTARLVEFDVLIRAGVPAISAHLLSDHYNKTRTGYYRALSLARQDINSFIHYAVRGLADGLREQLVTIRKHQFRTAWINYVYTSFRGHFGTTQHRRRDVVLALTLKEGPVSSKELRTLSPQIESAYRHLTDKTVARDINALARMGLIRFVRGGFTANVDQMKAFLAERSPSSPIPLPY